MPHIFICFFASFFLFLSLQHCVQFHSRITKQTERKKMRIQSTVNTEMRGGGKKQQQEERKIQLSKHTQRRITFELFNVQYIGCSFFMLCVRAIVIVHFQAIHVPCYPRMCSLRLVVTCCLMDILQYWTWPNQKILISYINRTSLWQNKNWPKRQRWQRQ